MSLLSRLRLVTVDVTGTLIAYRGQLGDYYCMAAKSAGMPCPDYRRVHEGFKLAYADMSRRHPCFGHAAAMPTADWWKICVRDSFVRVTLKSFAITSHQSMMIDFAGILRCSRQGRKKI